MFAAFQAAVLPKGNESFLLHACQVTWDGRLFTIRYLIAFALCLSIAWLLWVKPSTGVKAAQLYLLTSVLLRFMFNVFPNIGPDAGLFPLPPGTSMDPPVYLLPVTLGVLTGTVQIFALTLISVHHFSKKDKALSQAGFQQPGALS